VTRALLAGLAATAALVAGCGSGTGSRPTPASATTSAAAAGTTAASRPVPPQLQFSAKTIDGKDFAGESLLGKPAVLWFWAPWCPVCQSEAPMVGQIAAAAPWVTFVGVAGLDQLPAMQQFVDNYPVKGFTQLADTDGSVWAKFGVTQQPAYAFIRADGGVNVVKGGLSEPDLSQRVAAISP
jgi:thiol-disulfide isomerase/thioredoxin